MSWTRARASTRSTLRPSCSGDGARDLRDFDGVGEAVAEMIGIAAGEDLGLGFQAAEGAGVDDAVAVALEVVAVRMRRLGITASAGVLDLHRVVSQHGGRIASGSWQLASALAI